MKDFIKFVAITVLVYLIGSIKVISGAEAAALSGLPQLKNSTYIVVGAFSGYSGLTIGNTVFIMENDFNVVIDDKCLLLHELTHSNQYASLGVISFLYMYVTEYVGYRIEGMSHDIAYESISLESVAHANSEICYANSQ